MARKITQETFDDVVRENMEDFDMDSAEALADAISQFNKQGVDLSSIDISGGIGRDEILEAIASVVRLSAETGASPEDVVASINRLAALCAKEHEYGSRNRIFCMDKGGVNALHVLIDPNQSTEVLKAAIECLDDLSKNTGTRLSS